MGDDYEYVSYKSPKTIVAETVYHFFRGGLYGAAFGMVGTKHDRDKHPYSSTIQSL